MNIDDMDLSDECKKQLRQLADLQSAMHKSQDMMLNIDKEVREKAEEAYQEASGQVFDAFAYEIIEELVWSINHE